MRMKKLGKLMVLGSIIGTMLSVNAAFASGLDTKYASDPNFFAAYHEGKEIPFDDKVAVYGGGDMYYPDMTYCDNNMIAAREGKTKFEYDKRGFLLATGFADAAEKDMEARAKVNYVNDNKLDLKNIELSADGFIEFSGGYLGHWASGEQYNNEIVIENSTIETTNKSSVGIYGILSRNGNGVAKNNSVLIKDSEINNINALWIYGAVATEHYDDKQIGYAEANTVRIESSKIDTKNASGSYIVGGIIERKGNAIDNSVVITGSENDLSEIENANIYGGMATNGDAIGNMIDVSYANLANNTFVAGYADGGDAIDNTLNIRHVDLTGSSLNGGVADGDVRGNTLNVGENIVGELDSIGGFNTINFESLDWENGGTVLKTKDMSMLSGTQKEDGTSVYVKAISGGVKAGEYMNLIVSENAIEGSVYNEGETQRVKSGVAQFAEIVSGTVEQEENAVQFVISKTELNPQIQAIGEGIAAAGAVLANSGSMIVDSLDAMICDERIGTKTFAQIHGSDADYDITPDLDVNSWGAMAGIGETTADGLTYGVFYETGKGDYETYAQQESSLLRGNGDVEYSGGGFLMRQNEENGVYYEGSMRAGSMDNTLEGAIVDSHNELRGYDISSNYFGMHLGVGKIIPCSEGKKLDVFGKFLYTRLSGADFVIDGDNFAIDHLQSQKLRIGARYNVLSGAKLRSYYGVSYEYEFDGDVNGTVVGHDLETQSFGGSTLIGELGIHYNADEKWCVDVNIHGFEGARDGVGGRVQVNYLF